MREKRPFTPRDIASLTSLNSVQFTPAATILVNYTVRDLTLNNFKDSWCLIDADANIIVSREGSSGQLSPDGSMVAFVCGSSLTVFNLGTHVMKEVAKLYSSEYFMGHMAEQNFAWSPDSKSIAYVSTHATEAPVQNPVAVVDRLLYKTKGGRGRNKFAGNDPYHIWIIPINGGETKCITPGPFNEHSISWSPDGEYIAFISDRSGDPDRNHKNDLYKINVRSQQTECIVSGNGTRFKPVWSPGGEHIAFLGDDSSLTSKDSPAPDVHVYTVRSTGGDIRCHTRTLDRRTDNVKWSSGRHIYFTAADQGSTGVYRIDIENNKVEDFIKESCLVKDYCVEEKSGKIAIIKSSSIIPDEVYLAQIDDRRTRSAQTSFHDNLRKDFALADAEMFWCTSADNTPVQGWLMKPYNYKSTNIYPCVLVIHGGPHNMYGYEFDEKFQVLSSAGFGVLFVNPRGSTGYGQQFVNGNLNNWGGKDYEDLILALKYAIDQNPWINSDRLFVTGQSYGGFMTNWIITQTNMFRAAVSDGGLSNLISFAGTSLYHCLIEAEFNGDTWNRYDLLWNWSPLKYVKSVTTPTLFLHGETDNEVPVSQSEEMFSSLKRLGVETQMVRYQDEGHGWRPDLLPLNRIDLYERMINWFRRF